MIENIISHFLSIVPYFFHLIQDTISKLSSRPKTRKKINLTNVFTVSDRAHLGDQSDLFKVPRLLNN